MTIIDFNRTHMLDHAARAAYSDIIVGRIDTVAPLKLRKQVIDGIVEDIAEAPPTQDSRPGRSVSASMVGDDCARRVQLEIWPTFHPDAPRPKEIPLDDKTLAIFERGHRTEAVMAGWMKEAGFELSTHSDKRGKDGQRKQHGFEAVGGQIKGYADGLLHDVVPSTVALWENKTVGDRSWNAFERNGVIEQSPRYDSQVQLLMAYMESDATLFTILNADTAELYAELVPFSMKRAQAASDHAVDILRATRAGDLLPRIASSGDVFPCKYCRRRIECWGD